MPEPIYTPENCNPAFQLRWSLALFTRTQLPPVESWCERLAEVVEPDGVRLLEHQFTPPAVWFFLLSTKPNVAPPQIVKSVKGRLQHLIRDEAPKAFRRNFSLTSIGDVRRETVEAYVGSQLKHHRMADDRVQQQLGEFQLTFPSVDLSQPQLSSHGQYIYNLHLVLVHQDRWRGVERRYLEVTRDTIIRAARKKRHRVSVLSLFADHLHITMGCPYQESPEEAALGYLNNLAYAHGMKEIYCYSYYVGAFGEYDLGAAWRVLS